MPACVWAQLLVVEARFDLRRVETHRRTRFRFADTKIIDFDKMLSALRHDVFEIAMP